MVNHQAKLVTQLPLSRSEEGSKLLDNLLIDLKPAL